MKKLVYILFAFLALSAALGCSRSVDKRLVLADTLMWTNPDSSLAILNSINRDSLQGEENLAYHALLLTQAQFRCNGNCSSDTLINSALDYYGDNHNREHYTRALLYKGAYYESHVNQPVEAIKWYKQAENNADTTDYRNLAQINFRMGMLYYKNYADHEIDLQRFKKSLKYYTIIDDKEKVMLSHGYIGKIFRLSNQDSAQHHLDCAIFIADEIGDSADLFDCITSKSLSCFIEKDYLKAKDLAIFAVENGKDFINDHSYYNAARAYCALNTIDSAWFYVNKAEALPSDKQLLSIRYLTISEIYDSIGDINNYKKYYTLFYHLTDSLANNTTLTNILNGEKAQQQKSKAIVVGERNSIAKVLKWLIIVFVFLGICFLAFIMKERKDKIAYRDTLKAIKNKTVIEKEQSNQILSQLENKNKYLGMEMKIKDSYYDILRDMVSHHILIMDRLANVYETGSEKNFKREFLNIVANYRESENFWEAAEQYVNNNYNGLLDKILQNNKKLSDKQLKILTLHCLGFDYVNCAVIFGTNTSSMGVMCSRLADKLGTELSLKRYVETMKVQCLTNN